MSFQVCELFICGVSSSLSLQSKLIILFGNVLQVEIKCCHCLRLVMWPLNLIRVHFARRSQYNHLYISTCIVLTHARTHAHTHTYAPTRETYYTWENAVEWLHTFQRSVTKMKCKCLISLPCLVKMSLDVNNIIIQKDCILECC